MSLVMMTVSWDAVTVIVLWGGWMTPVVVALRVLLVATGRDDII